MATMCKLLILFLVTVFSYRTCSGENATVFLADYNSKIAGLGYNASQAAWKKASNITKHNAEVSATASKAYSKISKDWRERAKKVSMVKATDDEKRQMKLMLTTMSSSNASVVDQVIKIGGDLETIYSEACIPANAEFIKTIKIPAGKTCLSLDNFLNPIMATSRDPKELEYVWNEWRKATGPNLKSLYKDYVRLNNIGAKENGYEDAGDYKRRRYEVDDLEESAEKFWDELKDFYEELHAYVRHRLQDKYPGEIEVDGAIPAHLLGNMWAQSWENIFDIVSPYPSKFVCFLLCIFLLYFLQISNYRNLT